MNPPKYQVALSFAGEQRDYVHGVAEHLKRLSVTVFYDGFETVNLWGRSGTEAFHEAFAKESGYVVMFISQAYITKDWPILERRSALSRMIQERGEYILPIRFDESEVPGLPTDKIFLCAQEYTPEQLATTIARKIGIRIIAGKGNEPRTKYTLSPLEVLLAQSCNQCTHPDCSTTLFERATEHSETIDAAHICQIHENCGEGSAGESTLTQDELNSPENLILFCRSHQALVEDQREAYPSDLLKEWKRNHEAKMRERLSADVEQAQSVDYSHQHFPKDLVDQKIKDEVNLLRKSLFFIEFDRTRVLLSLGERLLEGELSGGSDKVRSWALAWCARLLSRSEFLDKAEGFLDLAKKLGTSAEIDIADAFIVSQKGNRAKSLQILAQHSSTSSNSAALMIVEFHDGPEGAIKWLKRSGFEAAELDSDGKSVLLKCQLENAQWKAGLDTVATITERDFEATPVLHHFAGLTKLFSAVPAEFRAIVLEQVPFEIMEFPLASDAGSMEAQKEAHRHFLDAVEVAQRLGFPRAEKIDDEYALWLELRDPDQSTKGRNRLETKLRDPNSALSIVHIALQLGIELDTSKIEQDIEREIARNGETTPDAARARFALAITKSEPAEAADYLARNYNQLSTYFDKYLLQIIQIEMLARAGLSDRARKRLDELSLNEITDLQRSRVRRLIASTEGEDSVEVCKQQFAATGSLHDLIDLVNELETRKNWDELCDYGTRLFDETGSLRDAERLSIALSNTHRFEALVDFMEANPDILSQSNDLEMSYAWALYYEGALNSAHTVLGKLNVNDESKSPNFRALQVNLAISLGDWNSLSTYVENEYQQRDNRSAEELMGTAQLALHLELPLSKKLVHAAVAKAGNNAAIFASAYFLATNADWEDDPQVSQWLEKSAHLSADDGPLRRMSLKDVLDMKPQWDQRESELWSLMVRGEIPIYLAAKHLNRSLVDLTMFPALANLSERDPRRCAAIPAYSGTRQPVTLDTDKTSVGIEATALITLSFLGILDCALDAFDTVYIPHSTLAWLFEEKQKATFHQPSRIRIAHQVRHLIATDVLEAFVPSTVPNSDLSAHVGNALAALIAEADKFNNDSNTQRIVVRPAPVHRLSTLMEEEADLSSHSAVMSSCLAIVEKLRQQGTITTAEEECARAYLHLHEKRWPNQPEISDGAILYLDDLAVTYFLQIGVLGKIKAAGLRPVVTSKEVSESNELIAYEKSSKEVKGAIECVRAALNQGIDSGKVKVGRRRNFDEGNEQSYSEHPTLALIALAPNCEALIADDRHINQHSRVSEGGSQVPTFSTLDLIDALVPAGAISEQERLECRSRLRRAGYCFVPVSEEELGRYLNDSAVKNGKVIEIAELKAIRESILRARMGDWLQLPSEAPWLTNTFLAYIHVLKNQWKDGANVSEATARSNWIADQIDIRGWAHRLSPENSDNLFLIGRGDYIIPLLTLPASTQKNIIDAYWNWVEERILEPIKEQFPDLYDWLVDWHERHVAEIAETILTEQATS